ncbi:enoyl-CoA hydratase/isomerase family protein [Streptomyces sp. NPDC051985]|uniref:enoyl-CoA hydratase/isomerase family protein n=1 Tax=Streptomyces sp. NPDC051985 TaxID=3155807 RepID=UPI00343C17E8
MAAFETYRESFHCARMERDEDGILLLTFHDDKETWSWSRQAAEELGRLFDAIATDDENKFVIMTGTGEFFLKHDLSKFANDPESIKGHTPVTADLGMRRQIANVMRELEIRVPMIAAVNGPVQIHAEIPLMCDIVIAADTAYFADEAHVIHGGVPGDGAHVFWPAVLGLNRARYLLWMNQRIDAEEALRLGLVGEVLPADQLLDRAYAIARRFFPVPELTRRYTRELMIRTLKRSMLDELTVSLALTQLSAIGRVIDDEGHAYYR